MTETKMSSSSTSLNMLLFIAGLVTVFPPAAQAAQLGFNSALFCNKMILETSKTLFEDVQVNYHKGHLHLKMITWTEALPHLHEALRLRVNNTLGAPYDLSELLKLSEWSDGFEAKALFKPSLFGKNPSQWKKVDREKFETLVRIALITNFDPSTFFQSKKTNQKKKRVSDLIDFTRARPLLKMLRTWDDSTKILPETNPLFKNPTIYQSYVLVRILDQVEELDSLLDTVGSFLEHKWSWEQRYGTSTPEELVLGKIASINHLCSLIFLKRPGRYHIETEYINYVFQNPIKFDERYHVSLQHYYRSQFLYVETLAKRIAFDEASYDVHKVILDIKRAFIELSEEVNEKVVNPLLLTELKRYIPQ